MHGSRTENSHCLYTSKFNIWSILLIENGGFCMSILCRSCIISLLKLSDFTVIWYLQSNYLNIVDYISRNGLHYSFEFWDWIFKYLVGKWFGNLSFSFDNLKQVNLQCLDTWKTIKPGKISEYFVSYNKLEEKSNFQELFNTWFEHWNFPYWKFVSNDWNQ